MESLPPLGADGQRRRCLVPVPVPAPTAAPVVALCRATDVRGPIVQHRGQLRHQHQLAVLFGRERPRLRGSDGRSHGAELRVGGGRNRGRHRSGARFRAQSHRPAGQLLGGSHSHLLSSSAADLGAVRDRLRRRRRGAEPAPLHRCPYDCRRQPDVDRRPGRQPGGHQGTRH